MFIQRCFHVLFLLLLASSLQIIMPDELHIKSSFRIQSQNSKGDVKYIVENLPDGLELISGRIAIINKSKLIIGVHPVKIKASDEENSNDQKIVMLIVDDLNSVIQQKNVPNQQRKQQNNNSPSATNIPETLNGIPVSSNIEKNNQINLPNTDKSIILPKTLNTNQNYRSSSQLIFGNILDAGTLSMPDNIISDIIMTKKAKIVPKNPTVADPLKNNFLQDRQVRLSKDVANMLFLVKQTTANKNAAIEQIEKRTSIFNRLKDNQFKINLTLQERLEDFNKTIQQVRETFKSYGVAKTNIQKLNTQFSQKKKEQDLSMGALYSIQKKLQKVNDDINKTQSMYNQLGLERDEKNKECQSLDSNVKSINLEQQRHTEELINLKSGSEPAKIRLKFFQQRVEDLKSQLKRAEEQVGSQRLLIEYYQSQQSKINKTMSNLEGQLAKMKQKIKLCEIQQNKIQQNVSILINSTLQNLLAAKNSVETQFKIEVSKLDSINSQLNKFPEQIKKLNSEISQFQKNFRNQQRQIDDDKFDIFFLRGFVQDAHEEFVKSQRNLQSAKNRYYQQQKKLQDYLQKLNEVRTQKQRIDNQINLQLGLVANVKPYAIVEVQNINEYGQTTDKKNTISSQIDKKSSVNVSSIQKNLPIKQTFNQKSDLNIPKSSQKIKKQDKPKIMNKIDAQTMALMQSGGIKTMYPNKDGSYTIKSITQFILVFFGPNIEIPPLSAGILYPLKQQFQLLNVSQASSIFPDEQSMVGYVISIRSSSFGMLSDIGIVYQVQYSSKVKTFSVQPNTIISAGFRVIIRGIVTGKRIIIASMIFCANY